MNTTKTQKAVNTTLPINPVEPRIRGEYMERGRYTKIIDLTEADIREIERKISEQFKELDKGSTFIRMLEIQTKHLHVPREAAPQVKPLKKK